MRNDQTIYERNASEWWNPSSPAFRSLHAVNSYRVALVLDWLGTDWRGKVVVDLGCGGGLMAGPFAHAGARVVGLDLSQGSVRAASERIGARFVLGDALHVPLQDESADFVLLADVLEHVEDPEQVVRESARVLRPGGRVYVSTINRTRRAAWIGVRLAEGVGLVPRGTHDPDKFLAPEELTEIAGRHGLELE